MCFDVPFSRIADLARAGRTLEQIRSETGCSGGCGMCAPYIDVVIATGRTVLPVMSESVCRAIVDRARRSPDIAANAPDQPGAGPARS